MGCGGSSSGSTSDYESGGPKFDSHWELGFFVLFSFLSLSQSVVHPKTGPSRRCINTDFQLNNKNEGLAEQLKAKQLNIHGMRNKFGTIVALGLFNKAFGAYSFPKILVDEEKYIKLDSWSKD